MTTSCVRLEHGKTQLSHLCAALSHSAGSRSPCLSLVSACQTSLSHSLAQLRHLPRRSKSPTSGRDYEREIDELFATFDVNGDGSLDYEELHRLLREVCICLYVPVLGLL